MEIVNLTPNVIPEGAAVYVSGLPSEGEVLVVRGFNPLDKTVTAVPMDRNLANKILADQPLVKSAANELPAVGERVMWYDGEWCIGIRNGSNLDGNDWWEPEGHWDMLKITNNLFWMPLPPAPAEIVGE